jgi:uncharacterized RDD family membrane protein YckC
MAENHAFFVRGDDGEEYGPVGLGELREWVTENRVGLGTSVRLDAPDGTYHAWQHYPELVALLAEVHVSGAIAPSSLPVLAPLGRRSVAFLLDLFLASILVLPPSFVLYFSQPIDVLVQQTHFWQEFWIAATNGANPPDTMPPLSTGYLVGGKLLSFFLPLLYFAGFHAVHGRTPAKSIFHLQVVDALGRKPSLGVALFRGFILMISVNLYGIPLIYAFFNPQRRALHDLLAGTYVVEA